MFLFALDRKYQAYLSTKYAILVIIIKKLFWNVFST